MSNVVNTIEPLLNTLRPMGAEEGKSEAPQGMFGNIFSSAIDAVRETDAEKVQAEYLAATGQLDNPAALTIASTKALTSVQLLVQLRNRALDAYSELMRISL